MAKAVADILATNLKLLMEENRDELGSQPKIVQKVKAKGRKIGQRTVGRALKGEVSTTIGSLEAIAVAFGVEPWQLLVPPPEVQPQPSEHDIAKVEELKRLSADLTPAQRELFVNSPEARDLVAHYPSNRMDERKWSAATKTPSRRTS